MKHVRIRRRSVVVVRALAACAGLFAVVAAGGSEQVFDRVEDLLTFSAANDRARARVSGTLDGEAYLFQLPAPGVLRSRSERLVAPRLSLFLDAQLGPRLYFFAQARVDRGFDPGVDTLHVRLDEYALRYTPRGDGRFVLQAGKFATIVGSWAGRHLSWSNPFITAPAPYEQLTGIWDTEPARSSALLLQWSHVRGGFVPPDAAVAEKALRVPIVWGPSYNTGVAVSADVGAFRWSAEVKSAALSSRPEAWQHPSEGVTHPTVSARVGYRPGPAWDFGFSASEGSYLREFAERDLARGVGRGAYRQRVLAHDASFAWHHWQVWAEVFAARFEIPGVGDADTVAYYVETKYKLTPQLSGGLRWNQQLYGDIPDRGRSTTWGHETWRIDLAPAYRFTPHTQLKLQYSLQRGDIARRAHTRTLAAQFTIRF